MDDDALLAVCRTTYRRALELNGGSLAGAKEAVRFELGRAGFETADDDLSSLRSVVAVLEDGRFVQYGATDNWSIQRYPAPG